MAGIIFSRASSDKVGLYSKKLGQIAQVPEHQIKPQLRLASTQYKPPNVLA